AGGVAYTPRDHEIQRRVVRPLQLDGEPAGYRIEHGGLRTIEHPAHAELLGIADVVAAADYDPPDVQQTERPAGPGGAEVAGISDTVPVGIALIRVRDLAAVVETVAHAVPIGVDDLGAVVCAAVGNLRCRRRVGAQHEGGIAATPKDHDRIEVRL